MTPQFDIHTWNQAANTELRAEFQKMAVTLAGDLEKPKGYRTTAQYLGGVPIIACPPPPPTRQKQQRGTSRAIFFALVGTFFAELPAVIGASSENKAAAIGTMIANMTLAAAGAGATVLVIEAIERALQGACEGIFTRAASNLAVSIIPIFTLSLGSHFCSFLVPSLPQINRPMQHVAL